MNNRKGDYPAFKVKENINALDQMILSSFFLGDFLTQTLGNLTPSSNQYTIYLKDIMKTKLVTLSHHQDISIT